MMLPAGKIAAYAGAVLLSVSAVAQSDVASATAITQVFGDGQKLTAVALEYSTAIQGAKLSPSVFRVPDRTVTRVYASATLTLDHPVADGRYVMIELSPADAGASLKARGGRGGGPGGPGGGGPQPGQGNGSPRAGEPAGPGLGGTLAAQGGSPRGGMMQSYLPAIATVIQTGIVVTAGGRELASSGAPIVTSKVKNLIVEDFQQLEFHDPKTGDTLKYNLFVPKNYDRAKSYPMVLFMPDASATNPDPFTTLRQGLGAIVFASPEEQAKHPSFVLAPQFATQTVNDQSEATSMLDTTIHLIGSLEGQYRIDRKRLYSTGQSGGAMMTIAMNIKYPDLYAASFIVAGQWDPAKVDPLAKEKLWILVSEGDLKAFPGENAITSVLEKDGATVSRATWDGRSTPQQFSADVAAMEARHAQIQYTVLAKGTVVPPGEADNGGSNHTNTWRIAYTIAGIRDWLFQQSK